MYLTYTEYQEYGGTLDETTFNEYEFDARSKIDWYTFGRLKNETTFNEAVKRCMYKLIKLIQLATEATMVDGSTSGSSTSSVHAGIASQSNDGVSISYNVLSAKDMLETSNSQIEDCIKQYLDGVVNSLGKKLLYRGMYPDE